jgi:2-polyprenyl-3-methyl-5-hydroxy-6-metoxy-1,4-benzoquinol methylase
MTREDGVKRFTVGKPLRRVIEAVRWRMGLNVVSKELESGTDEAIKSFYSSRATLTGFLSDPHHYERPRADWIVAQVSGGRMLEVGCGDGGMTVLLSPKVERIVALDASEVSLRALKKKGLGNVETRAGLIETVTFEDQFDWIVLSEVIEHLRKPALAVKHCFEWLAPGGSLLLTTPNGHWESNEHLHEFSLDSFTEILVQVGAESIRAGFIRDEAGKRRWLFGQATRHTSPPTQDQFHDRRATAKMRRRGR